MYIMSKLTIAGFFARNNGLAITISILFFVFFAQYGLSYLFHHPDEIHYTNAVTTMLESGDYMTPTYSDGSFRFIKPIITYWSILISYLIFGISEFSSKLPSLLSASAFLYFIFWQVKILYPKSKIAILAMLIVATNPLYIQCSSRNLPDIWLCIFLTMVGFASLRLLMNKGKTSRSTAMFYIGASMAVAAKGLPGVAYALAGIVFMLLNPVNRIKIRPLLSPFWIIVALFIASFWYVTMYLKHGDMALIAFVDDQVNVRVGNTLFEYFKGIGLSLLFLFAYFLPWIFQTKSVFKLKIKSHPSTDVLFILLWIGLTLFFCMVVSPVYDRYILPAIPMAALLLARLIDEHKSEKGVKRTASVIKITFGISILISLFAMWLFSAGVLVYIILLVMVIFNILIIYKCPIYIQSSLQFVSLFAIMLLSLSLYIFPHQGNQIAEYLKKEDITVVGVYRNAKVAAKLRVNTHGVIKINELDSIESGKIIIREREYDKLAQQPAIADTISYSWKGFPLKEMITNRVNGNLQDLKKEYSDKYYLINRK